MTRRLLTFGAALALLAAACGAPEVVPVDFGEGQRFVPLVADSQDQVGQGASIAVGTDGTSYISYFGFPAEVPEGEIAIPRPIGSPFLPGVLLASVDAEGLITKGAVQQLKPASEPAGIAPAFRPATVEDLDLSAANANGSAVAVAEDGTVHVAWTAGDAVYYAKVAAGADAAVSTVYEYGAAVAQAGPLGRPAIALDGAGSPWIAFGVNDGAGLREVVATPSGTEWDVADVAPLTPCNGCPQPLPSGIAVVGDAPVVVFGDPGANAVLAATPAKRKWSVTTVETGALGAGLSLAAGGETAVASYYDGAGAVRVATWDGAGWNAVEAAAAPSSADAPTGGLEAPGTDVAVGDDGTVWVAWEDAGVHLASGDGSTFTEVETTATADGTGPSVAVSAEGSVLLAWYDAASENLLVGVWGDPQEVLVALPSPAPTVSLAPQADTTCGEDGKLALDIVSLNIAFDLNCLVAPAGEPFEINFDNQDAGIPHNVAIYTDPSAATSLFVGETFNGIDQRTYAVDPLDAGSYFFRCDVHPTQMTGTLAAVEGAT